MIVRVFFILEKKFACDTLFIWASLLQRWIRFEELVYFSVLSLPQPSTQSLQHIFQTQLSRFINSANFASEVRDCTSQLVSAAVTLFRRVASALRPTPSKIHYTFNVRDLSQVLLPFFLLTRNKMMWCCAYALAVCCNWNVSWGVWAAKFRLKGRHLSKRRACKLLISASCDSPVITSWFEFSVKYSVWRIITWSVELEPSYTGDRWTNASRWNSDSERGKLPAAVGTRSNTSIPWSFDWSSGQHDLLRSAIHRSV